MIVQAESQEVQDFSLAKEVAETLHAHYPGHLWAVNVQGGVAVIKALNISSLYGYVLKYMDIMVDAGIRTKEIIRAGGEILERASMVRGQKKDGEKAHSVDGIANYNPVRV